VSSVGNLCIAWLVRRSRSAPIFDRLPCTTALMHTEACGAPTHEAVCPACTCTIGSERTGLCTRLVPLKWKHFKKFVGQNCRLCIILFTEVIAFHQDMAHLPVARGGDGLQTIENSCEFNEQGGRDCRIGVILQLGELDQWLTILNIWKCVPKRLISAYFEILKRREAEARFGIQNGMGRYRSGLLMTLLENQKI
jgi:hypothetical protein